MTEIEVSGALYRQLLSVSDYRELETALWKMVHRYERMQTEWQPSSIDAFPDLVTTMYSSPASFYKTNHSPQ